MLLHEVLFHPGCHGMTASRLYILVQLSLFRIGHVWCSRIWCSTPWCDTSSCKAYLVITSVGQPFFYHYMIWFSRTGVCVSSDMTVQLAVYHLLCHKCLGEETCSVKLNQYVLTASNIYKSHCWQKLHHYTFYCWICNNLVHTHLLHTSDGYAVEISPPFSPC